MRLTILFIVLLFQYSLPGQVIDFESTVPHITLDTSQGNLWQIGPPQKTFFDAAQSPVNALVTDTINNYPPNSVSSFVYAFPNPISANLGFWHKIDSEPNMDGGYIEFSIDTGQTWHLLSQQPLDLNTASNFPLTIWTDVYGSDTLFNGNLGVSGHNGWSKGNVSFLCNAVKNLNLLSLLRFNFISNGTNEFEGWMFDDFGTTYYPCSSNENIVSNQLNVFPNPATDQLIIDFGDQFLSGELFLSNVMGQRVLERSGLSDYSVELSVQELPSGIYYYHFITDEEVFYTGKLMISK